MSFIDKGFLMNANLDTRDVKNAEGRSVSFYNTDKNISVLYMKLILAQKGEPQRELQIDEVAGYKINITAIKPKTNQYRIVEGILSDGLVDESCAIWKFELDEEFTNQIGPVACWTKIIDGDKVLNMNSFAYDVNADGLTGLNEEITTNKDLPILEELITKVQKVNNINDIKVSETETYSNKKIEEKFSGVNAQFNTIEQKKADKTEVDIERKRLDNIIANSNSTEGNSELVDIRIGADGTVYDCAGKAVREQFSNNNSKIQESASKNTEQDNRLVNIEKKNKVQDVYLNGLFNENNDGRLTINGEGNDLKLEGSKAGLVTVDSVVGNTVNNLIQKNSLAITGTLSSIQDNKIKLVQEDTLEEVSWITSYNLKANSIYSLVYTVYESTIGASRLVIKGGNTAFVSNDTVALNTTVGTYVTTFIGNPSSIGNSLRLGISSTEPNGNHIVLSDVMYLFEGDYTNKPIPTQVFTGLQSSFEENKVTQEMVTAGTELASNLGKYKVSAKVVGKNINSSKLEQGGIVWTTGEKMVATDRYRSVDFIEVMPNTIYVYNANADTKGIVEYDQNKKFIKSTISYGITTASNTRYVKLVNGINTLLQLERGTVRTDIVPYFESNHKLYLNSPLLKGDELICKPDGVYHVHNSKKIIITESDMKTYTESDKPLIGITLDTKDKKNNNKVLCDRYSSVLSGFVEENANHYYMNPSNIVFVFRNDKTVDELKKQLEGTKIVYELAEPYEEKISDNKLLLEIANNSTLSVDSNIPVQSINASYSTNIPNMYLTVASLDELSQVASEQDLMTMETNYRLVLLEQLAGLS